MNKTVLIKFSGEAMAGDKGSGLDFEYIKTICSRIKEIHDMGFRIGIVCGGGNFLRGRDVKEMDRETADYAGMLATVMNGLVLEDAFKKIGCEVYTQSGLRVSVMDDVNSESAIAALDNEKIVVFGGGTGKPFFSTDTGAALRARDIKADMILKLTNVDGVYDKDPNKYENATKYEVITFDEVIEQELGVMDLSAMEICRDNNIEIIVMDINDEDGLKKAVLGEKIGTKVSKEE